MKKWFGIMLLGFLSFSKAQTWKTDDQYIQKFAK